MDGDPTSAQTRKDYEDLSDANFLRELEALLDAEGLGGYVTTRLAAIADLVEAVATGDPTPLGQFKRLPRERASYLRLVPPSDNRIGDKVGTPAGMATVVENV